jgi:hypothetical protein
MKARVSKNLTGTIVLGSVGVKSFTANQEFELTKEQYWSPDVQSAITKGWIVCAVKPKKAKTVQVTNISLGSVSIPGSGVLRSGKSVEMDISHVESLDIKRLEAAKKIRVGAGKSKAIREPEEGEFHVHEPDDRVEKGKKPSLSTEKTIKKSKKIVKRHEEAKSFYLTLLGRTSTRRKTKTASRGLTRRMTRSVLRAIQY